MMYRRPLLRLGGACEGDRLADVVPAPDVDQPQIGKVGARLAARPERVNQLVVVSLDAEDAVRVVFLATSASR